MFTAEDFKCHIREGFYHKFMLWMTQAMFGRPNHSILSLEGTETSLLVRFLQRILPDTAFHDRVHGSNRKRYPNNVTVFTEGFPRSNKQKTKVREIMVRSNVIVLNPPWYFLEDASIRQIHVQVQLSEACVQNADVIATFIRKSYCLYSFMPVYMSIFFQRNECIDREVPVQEAMESFVEYWKMRGIHHRVTRREILANAALLATGGGFHLNAKKQSMRICKLGTAPSTQNHLNAVQFIYLYYDRGFAFFQWLIRVALGLKTRSIFSITDATSTTLNLVCSFCGRCKIKVYDANTLHEFYEILDHGDYHLHIFSDVRVPLRDLMVVKGHANCLIIDRESIITSNPPTVLCARQRDETKNYCFMTQSEQDFTDFIDECYSLTVKEPLYAVFMQRMLRNGTLRYNQEYQVGDLLAEYELWCQHRNTYVEHYTIPNLLPADCFAFQISLFFKCSWDDYTITVHGPLKLNVE